MKQQRHLVLTENGREFYVVGNTAYVLDAKTRQRLAETEIPNLTDQEFWPWFKTRIKPRLTNKMRATEDDHAEKYSIGDYWNDNKDEITDYYTWEGGTPTKYNNTIENQLIPLLSHKPMSELIIDDYEQAIELLKNQYIGTYSQSRINQFKSNLSKIAEYAFRNGDCPTNPLQDEFLICVGKDKNLEEILSQRMTTRSLTSIQNNQILYQIRNDLRCNGQALGLAIMMLCGARDGETLSLDFKDIVRLPDGKSMSIWFNKGFDGEVTDHTKTENGNRIVPVHSQLQEIIETKILQIEEKGYTEDQIMNMPIVCRDEYYEERCSLQSFSRYAKETLLNAGVNRKIIIFPYDLDPQAIKSERLTPTAYMLRRNFATHAKYTAGLDLKALKYLMGHAQAEEENLKLYRYFNTDDAQMAMKKQLETWQVIPCNHNKVSPEDEECQPTISKAGIEEIENLQVGTCPGNLACIDEKRTRDNECNDYYIFVTEEGRMRRTLVNEYPIYKKNTSGVQGPDFKCKDFMKTGVNAKTQDMLLAYSNMGNVYAVPIDLIPCIGRTHRAEKETKNILGIDSNERIVLLAEDARADDSKDYLVIVTKNGKIQRTSKTELNKLRPFSSNENANGKHIMKIKEDDSIISAFFTNGMASIIIGTKNGKGICFNESNVSKTSSNTTGVVAIKLVDDDVCVGAEAIMTDDRFLFTISAKGRGKFTDISEWSGESKTQARSGIGKEIQTLNQTGDYIAALSVVSKLSEKVALLCRNGQLCRFSCDEVPRTSRSTAGVSLMKVKSDTEIKHIIMN